MTETLLQRVARGDQSAVRGVMDAFGGLVWSLARRFCANQTDAEDATQEIFLDVWRSAARFDPAVASEATFVAMIARRRLIDRARKAGRRPNEQTLVEPTLTDGGDAVSRRAELGDEVTRAARALERLTAEQQKVLKLSIYRGLSHEKIAEATGMPLGTVKTHARRGLIRLRELLESNGERAQGQRTQEVGS